MKRILKAIMLTASGAGFVWSFTADSSAHSAAAVVSVLIFFGYYTGK